MSFQYRERQGEDPCPVCLSDFDHQTHAPYTLPCGHTFCSSCLLHPSLVRYGYLCCPLCRCLSWQPRTLRRNMLQSNSTEQSLANQQTVTSEDNAGHSGIRVSLSERTQREENPVTISSNNRNQTERSACTFSQTRVWTSNPTETWEDGFSQRVRTFQTQGLFTQVNQMDPSVRTDRA
uniref:RING-type domain-containing protein n=1 Tax=Pygocentrus nattereri TaxID=42514 RepID=A0A3B4BPJ9_PYGNA